MAKLKMPYFSRGTYEALEKALATGIYKNLDRIVWHYITEGQYAGQLVLVDTEKKEVRMVGNNPETVLLVNSLPTTDIQANTIYIVNKRCYVYDAEIQSWILLYEDVTQTVEEMLEKIDNIENDISDIKVILDNKADKADTLSGYGITDAYTKSEIDDKLEDIIGDIGGEEHMSVKEYVDTVSSDTLDDAKNYVDSAIQLIEM